MRSILDAAGFGSVTLDVVDEPMVLGQDADDAFEFFGSSNLVSWLLEGVDDAGRAEAMDNLRTLFKQAETADGVLLGTSAWLVRGIKD